MELWMLCVYLTLGSVHFVMTEKEHNEERMILRKYDDNKRKVDCKDFAPEICTIDTPRFQTFAASPRSGAQCLESLATAQCLHDFANKYFPKGKRRDHYLCKIQNFQDRIEYLCLKEEEEDEAKMEENGSGEVEDSSECAEAENITLEECLDLTMPKMEMMFRSKKYKKNLENIQTLNCIGMKITVDCVMQRVSEHCEEELEALQERLETEIANNYFVCRYEKETVSDMISRLHMRDMK